MFQSPRLYCAFSSCHDNFSNGKQNNHYSSFPDKHYCLQGMKPAKITQFYDQRIPKNMHLKRDRDAHKANKTLGKWLKKTFTMSFVRGGVPFDFDFDALDVPISNKTTLALALRTATRTFPFIYKWKLQIAFWVTNTAQPKDIGQFSTFGSSAPSNYSRCC